MADLEDTFDLNSLILRTPENLLEEETRLRGMTALADDESFAFQTMNRLQEPVEDLLQHLITVKKAVIDRVEVFSADGPACTCGVKGLGDTDQGVASMM